MDVTRRTSHRFVLALLPLALLAGCVGPNVRAPSWAWFDGPGHGAITQLVTMWAEGVINQPDRGSGTPIPGFSGRFYLFGAEKGAPLGADGALRVCLFDCGDPRGAGAQPLEVWEFCAADLKRMLKKDGVGWGYNLWLPWSTINPEIRRVAMRAQYLPTSGMPVWSGTSEIQIGQPEPTFKTETHRTTSPRLPVTK